MDGMQKIVEVIQDQQNKFAEVMAKNEELTATMQQIANLINAAISQSKKSTGSRHYNRTTQSEVAQTRSEVERKEIMGDKLTPKKRGKQGDTLRLKLGAQLTRGDYVTPKEAARILYEAGLWDVANIRYPVETMTQMLNKASNFAKSSKPGTWQYLGEV